MTTTALPSAQDSPRVSPAEEVKHTGRKHGVGFYVAWACFILILLITVFPFYWMTSLRVQETGDSVYWPL